MLMPLWSWSLKHLNWTWVLSYMFVVIILLVIGAEGSEGKAIANILSVTILLPVSGWVIIQKGRSLWWILLAWLLSPLWLTNKKKSDSTEGEQ